MSFKRCYQSLILLFSLSLLSSCTSISTLSPVAIKNTSFPTATPTSRPTQKSTATLRPTRTTAPISTPSGAGLEPASFQVDFSISFDTLSPGDHAVMPLHFNTDINNEEEIYSLSLDGNQKEKLLSISSQDNREFNGTETTVADDGKTLFLHWVSESENKGGMLKIDLVAQMIEQFTMGCSNATPFIHGPFVSPGTVPHLAFSCDGKNRVWHFVSTETWEISSQAFPQPSGLYKTNDIFFLNDNLAIISDDFPYSEAEVKCLFKLDTGEKKCLKDVPNWWNPVSKVSPDGQNVVVWVPQGGVEDNGYGGIISLSCIENPEMDNCMPLEIPAPKDVPFWSLGSPREKLWAPDSEKFIGQFNLDNFTSVKLWIYELPSGQSRLVGTYPVLDLRGGWDNKSENVVATTWAHNGLMNWKINTDTGAIKRIDEGLTGKDSESYPAFGIVWK
jgi:hypothetical protein